MQAVGTVLRSGGSVNLDGDMRQGVKARQSLAVELGVALLVRRHGNDGPEMAWANALQRRHREL